MADPSLAQLADTLVWLAVLSYLAAAALLGLELGYRLRWPGLAGLAAAVAGLTLNTGRPALEGWPPTGFPGATSTRSASCSGCCWWPATWSGSGAGPRPARSGPSCCCRPCWPSRPVACSPMPRPGRWCPPSPPAGCGSTSPRPSSAAPRWPSRACSACCSSPRSERNGGQPQGHRWWPGGAQTAERAQVAQRLADHADSRRQAEVEAAGVPGTPRRSLWTHLPAAQTLDELAYRTTTLAFPIWTFGVIAGAIWGQAAWGRYWGWDPKETRSFIVWVLYAAYLHARATAGWRGRRAAWISAIGVAAITFNVYAVNLWLAGLHSYAT